MLCRVRAGRSLLAVGSLSALAACSYVPSLDFSDWGRAEQPVAAPAPDPAAPREPPLATRQFAGVDPAEEVLGAVQIVFSRAENTFVQLARAYDVGYEALERANPGIDAWLPGEDTPVYLPTMHVLPDVARDGIVLNLPSMRLMHFVADEQPGGAAGDVSLTVTSHPIGIGREGWATPTGEAEVTGKARDPVWYPPASVRAEHAELGDPLPSVVPPGPDNPLGGFAMGLSMPGYLIHGTNKPAGVGMRVSHGCIRLYPEDIEALFERVPPGTPVRIVDEPVLAGWRDGELYLEVHAPLAEDRRDLAAEAERVIAAAFERAGLAPLPVDAELVARIVAERRGIPFPVLSAGADIDGYLSAARIVENTVPPAALALEEQTARNEPGAPGLGADARAGP